MIQLKNNTKTNSKLGYVVSIDPKDPQSFIYSIPNSAKAIGVVAEVVAYRKLCKIATAGDTARVYVSSNVNKNDPIRLSKKGDNISLGACKVARSGDAPYLKIGDALSSGKGLIPMVLDLSYDYSTDASRITNNTLIITGDYTLSPTDQDIMVDSTTPVELSIYHATGSNRVHRIGSINSGLVTVTAYLGDNIDDETNQCIYEQDTMVIKDIQTNTWKIV